MQIIQKIFDTDLKIENQKNQILLTHTSRDAIDYTLSLKNRFNGKPIKAPHYIITRQGKIIKFLEEKYNSNFTNNNIVNSKSIVISLENLGWLEKVPLKNHYINWIGNIYNGEVVDRKWRDYFYWQPYTEIQVDKLVELCKELSKKHNIKLQCVGHNTKVKGVESFLGILTRSNFDEFVTDLSPAFDFENFIKKLKDE